MKLAACLLMTLLVVPVAAAEPVCVPEHRAQILRELAADGWAVVRLILVSAEFDPGAPEGTFDEIIARRSRADGTLQAFFDSLPSTDVQLVTKLPELNSPRVRSRSWPGTRRSGPSRRPHRGT